MRLDSAELDYIKRARGHGVLQDIDIDLYPEMGKIGNQCLLCADSDQASDIISHHGKILESVTTRNGWLGLYGGALLIPPHSPVNYGEGEIILEHLFIGHLLEKGGVIPLFSHAKCGMAVVYNLSIQDCFRLLGDAKLTVRQFFTERYDDIRAFLEIEDHLRTTLRHEPTETEFEVHANGLDRQRIRVIRRARIILRHRGMGLREFLDKPEPVVIAPFQVDYGDRKRTYMFNRHENNNMLAIEMAERALAA